jgi:hypothetical protein
MNKNGRRCRKQTNEMHDVRLKERKEGRKEKRTRRNETTINRDRMLD